MRNIVPIIAIGMLAVSATSAQAVQAVNLINNGSFETVNPALSFNGAGVIQVTGANTTALTSWGTGANQQFQVNNAYDAQAGNNSVDLSGAGGFIYQNVAGLTVGTKYRVSFALSGNPSATTDPRVRVSVANVAGFTQFTFDTPVGQSASSRRPSSNDARSWAARAAPMPGSDSSSWEKPCGARSTGKVAA